MRSKIVSELGKIEEQEKVQILYACESGSRAWGFASADSDFDVRFIYAHPTEWYLSIENQRDVIEYPVSNSLDLSGWDIRKALKLFRKSNPPLLEWLESPIVYLEKYSFASKMRDVSPLAFNPRSCLYHYLHMAEGNFRGYLQGETVRIKKYFYVLRPILACRWIELKKTMPPMEFEVLVNEVLPKGPLMDEVKGLLVRKRAGEELDSGPQITVINEFLEDQIRYYNEYPELATIRGQLLGKNAYDEIFRGTLKEIWD